MFKQFPHDDKGDPATIADDTSGTLGRVRARSGKRVAACLGAAIALALCTPLYAADATKHEEQAAPSDARGDADNTGRNERDRDNATMTPMDQSNDAHDIALTADIRKALVADKSLGTNAKNIKVITVGGRVTLRGPVDSGAERTRILEVAQRIAGVPNVTSEIELVAR